jgi:hypothetical protein
MLLNKKGIALETAVALIIGVVFLVVILYIILRTGLLGAFQTQVYGLMCTASSYARGILVGLIMTMWGAMSIALSVVIGISSGGSFGVGTLTQTSTKLAKRLLQQTAAGGMGVAVFALISFLSLSTIMTYLAILPLISGIPLFCPAVTIDIGTQSQEASEIKFLGELSAATVDCWNMYGSGSLDPLIAIDPPNPRTCRIIEAYINNQTPINVTMIYDYTITSYGEKWPLGSDRLFIYCNRGGTFQDLGNDPNDWANKCSFDKARIYVMFRDSHDYDLVSFGTGICQGQIPEDDFSDVKDAMVWCIEDI